MLTKLSASQAILSKLVLTSELVTKSQQHLCAPAAPPVLVKRVPDGIFYPDYVDKLYWCFYIIRNGRDEYDQIGQKAFVTETSDKIDLVHAIRSNRDKVAVHKTKSAIERAETDIVGSPFISLETFEILCIVFGLNVLLVRGKRMCRMHYSDSEPVVLHAKDARYGVELGAATGAAERYAASHITVDDMEKPLRSVSYYKREALQDIARRLGLADSDKQGKSKTKAVLYQEILETI